MRLTVLSAMLLAAAACTEGPSLATSHAAPRPVTQCFARHRFTVTFTSQALEKADDDRTNLLQAVGQALSGINALLRRAPVP